MEMTQVLNQNMQQLQDVLHKNMMTTGELQRQKFDTMARQQETLIKSTEKRLDDMRLMVEEKLQKTLNERIGQSFEIVRSQLENVQKVWRNEISGPGCRRTEEGTEQRKDAGNIR